MMENASTSVVNSAETEKLIYLKILVTVLISFPGLKPAHLRPLNFSVVYMKCHPIKLHGERREKSS